MFDVMGGVVEPVSVLGSPPGSFGTLADDRREEGTDGACEIVFFVGDETEVHRDRGLGNALRNPTSPPLDGGGGAVCIITSFTGAS